MALDDAGQRLALSAEPDAFDGDRATWGLVRAQLFHWRGDTVAARVWGDTARGHFARQLRAAPEDGQLHALHGLALPRVEGMAPHRPVVRAAAGRPALRADGRRAVVVSCRSPTVARA